MSSIKDKAMRPMFWVGAFCTAVGSWLLALSVLIRLLTDRSLSSGETITAFVSAIGFSVVFVSMLWRKIQKIR